MHLWLLDINRFSAADYAYAERIMSDSEHQRAQKMQRGKENYIASRWLLRKVLAHYTGIAADSITFLRTDKGKPCLPNSNIHFSLSHSGHWALLAVANCELIGVDIEAIKTTRKLSAIAEHYYHPLEVTQLQALVGDVQRDYFYRLWTLKEAFLKATGLGISAGLEKICFALNDDSINAKIALEQAGESADWQFHQWALTAQDYCALAYKAPHALAIDWFDALDSPAFS